MAQTLPVIAPEGETMDRDLGSPLCFDDIGFTRTTFLVDTGCRARCIRACKGFKGFAICFLDKVLPKVKSADPMQIAEAVDQGWTQAKKIDQHVPFLEKVGELSLSALKCCLLYPCIPAQPTTIVIEGWTDYTSKGEVKKRIVVQDKRSDFDKCMGFQKGVYHIYEDGKFLGRTYYEKNRCKKIYYRLDDANEIPIAKMRLADTLWELLEHPCCVCCFPCGIPACMACATCKCCRKQPLSRVLAPEWKNAVYVYPKKGGCGCCVKKAKFEIKYDTLYVPGQDESADDSGKGCCGSKSSGLSLPSPSMSGEEGEDAPVSDKDMYKVNKGVKGKNTYRYIYFKQPGCLAQFKKRLLMATCCLPTEELEVEAKVSSKANETPETEVASSSPEANEIRQEKETEKRTNGFEGVPAGFKKSKFDVWDVQFGKEYTVAQKWAAILHVLKDFTELQD